MSSTESTVVVWVGVLVGVVVTGVLLVVTGIAVLVVVLLVLFKHLTDGLSNHSGTNSSITHNPLGLRAKSVLYTGEISADNYTQAVKTSSLHHQDTEC